MKTKINENQKVTLTLGQLKRLVKESTENDAKIMFNTEDKYDKAFVFVNPWYTTLIGANSEEGLASLLDSEFSSFPTEECAIIAADLWNLDEGDSMDLFNANWYRVR